MTLVTFLSSLTICTMFSFAPLWSSYSWGPWEASGSSIPLFPFFAFSPWLSWETFVPFKTWKTREAWGAWGTVIAHVLHQEIYVPWRQY